MSLIAPEEAQRRILEQVFALPSESAELEDALFRATASDLTAQRTLPQSDNSAMDGYAVRSADVGTTPITLNVVERIFAGQSANKELGPSECSRIMTGAPLPRGADAVVMQEKTRAVGDAQVEVLEGVSARANVRDRGEESLEGEPLLSKGTALGVAELGLLWGQGFTEVAVHRRPRVGIVASGDELVEVGGPHGGKVYDTNSPVLAALVRHCGGVPRKLGIAPDRLEAIRQKIETGLSPDFDVLLVVAGMSVGERDYVREVLAMLGVKLELWRVAMKPGKPVAFGTRGRTLVFGLPGNPVSALVTFELFVRPALRKLQGVDPRGPRLTGTLAEPLRKAAGLRHYVRASSTFENGRLTVRPLRTQSSGAWVSATGATHLISVPPEATSLAAGDEVELIALSWAG